MAPQISHYTIPSFTFTSGATLPIRLVYTIHSPTTTPNGKTALIPTCYGGRLSTTHAFPRALRAHRTIVVAMLGNSESSSPSNDTSFPAQLDYRDEINAQHALSQHLGVAHLDVVVGFSMGGQQAYYWAAMYPDFVSRAVVICGSARTSGHNIAFLEGPIAALTNAVDYEDGGYREKGTKPARALKAFTRAYRAWLHSAEWYREGHWKRAVDGSVNGSVLESVDKAEDGLLEWDPEDLLVLARMWQRGHLGVLAEGERVVGGEEGERKLEEILGSIRAKMLLMPARTDQYFRPEDNELELRHLHHGTLAVIDTVWGHATGGGAANEADTAWMETRIEEFLKE